ASGRHAGHFRCNRRTAHPDGVQRYSEVTAGPRHRTARHRSGTLWRHGRRSTPALTRDARRAPGRARGEHDAPCRTSADHRYPRGDAVNDLFGTDGVRGVANEFLTPELAFALGRAGGHVLAAHGLRRPVLVGRDTRLSGPMLEAALCAGLASVG